MKILVTLCLLFSCGFANAQLYDLVIRNGKD